MFFPAYIYWAFGLANYAGSRFGPEAFSRIYMHCINDTVSGLESKAK